MVKQISVFVENKHGRIMEILSALAEYNVDIKALSVADSTDFGIMRMIVSDDELAKKVLNENGVIVRVNNVIAVAVNDEPGALMKTFAILCESGISVEYMYAFAEKLGDSSVIVIRTDNQENAVEKLKLGRVTVLQHDDIKNL